ncbi:multiple cyclophane-containing RiPP AmcA [Streptomyces sp. NPDC093707]
MGADPPAVRPDRQVHHRPAWDNAGSPIDNRATWDNWNKKK